METKNYYEILGVNQDASTEEIKKSYKKLSLKFHPDRNVDKSEEEQKEAEEKFKEISVAYETLSDENKRKQYDLELKYGSSTFSSGGFNPFGGFGHFAENFFNRKHNHVEKGSDVQVNLNVTLDQIFHNKKGKITFKRNVPCEHCEGTGAENGKIKTCEHCHGTGIINNTRIQGNMMFTTQTTCPHCQGRGTIIEKHCPKCYGSGFTSITDTIEINIPKEIIHDSYTIIEGKGNLPASKGAIPGNLIIVFKIAKDEYFDIIDNTLVHNEYVPITDCLLGGKIEVETISGKTLTIDLPELTPNGKQYIFEKDGMWNRPYIVIIHHKLPQKLNKKQKDLLKQFAKEIDK